MLGTQKKAEQGVIQSSIALLQERFKQVERVKEMREKRELLQIFSTDISKISTTPNNNNNNKVFLPPNYYNYSSYPSSSPTTSSSSSSSSLLNNNKLSHEEEVLSLSMWPLVSASATRLKQSEKETGPTFNFENHSYSYSTHSFASDVDTTLHL